MANGKIQKELDAIRKTERELKDRKAKVAELERVDREKRMARLVRKIGTDNAIELLDAATHLGPKLAVDLLKDKVSKG